jgi:hypothetical protein
LTIHDKGFKVDAQALDKSRKQIKSYHQEMLVGLLKITILLELLVLQKGLMDDIAAAFENRTSIREESRSHGNRNRCQTLGPSLLVYG